MIDLAVRLNQLTSYIETNLYEPITLDTLESVSGFSRFQIIRLFNKLCGYSPIEYIRRRRLSNSIPDLYADKKILDIALDHGFDYEQSYIRAFRSVYGISPAKFSRRKQEVEILEPIELGNISVYSDRFVVGPQIKYLSGVTYSGRELFYNYKNNNVRGEPLLDGTAGLKSGTFTGICIPYGSGTFTHRYISCIEGDTNNDISYTLPDDKYALFTYSGLHPLDEEGAHKIRILTYIIIGSWAAKNGVIWDENFVEQVEKESLSDDYCEVQIMIRLRPIN